MSGQQSKRAKLPPVVGVKKKKAAPAEQPAEGEGMNLAVLYGAAAVVGGTIIVGVLAYVLWPAAKDAAVAATERAAVASVMGEAHDLIAAAITLEFGQGGWGELEFAGPIPGEPVRKQILERFGSDPQVAGRYAREDEGACAARINVNIRPKPGKRSGREMRIYWVGSDRSVVLIGRTDPELDTVANAIAAGTLEQRKSAQ